jgi:hypothetical protein
MKYSQSTFQLVAVHTPKNESVSWFDGVQATSWVESLGKLWISFGDQFKFLQLQG